MLKKFLVVWYWVIIVSALSLEREIDLDKMFILQRYCQRQQLIQHYFSRERCFCGHYCTSGKGYKILFLLPCLIRRKLKMTTRCPIKIICLLRRKFIITEIFLGNLLIFKDRTNFIPDLYCFVFNQDSCGAKCLNWMFYKGFHSKCDIAGLVMMMIFKQR